MIQNLLANWYNFIYSLLVVFAMLVLARIWLYVRQEQAKARARRKAHLATLELAAQASLEAFTQAASDAQANRQAKLNTGHFTGDIAQAFKDLATPTPPQETKTARDSGTQSWTASTQAQEVSDPDLAKLKLLRLESATKSLSSREVEELGTIDLAELHAYAYARKASGQKVTKAGIVVSSFGENDLALESEAKELATSSLSDLEPGDS